MVIKVYISGISASKEIKKRQQRALLILDSCKVDYESIDITEPGLEEMREFMVQNSKIREPNKTPLSPQFFNDDVYCGDYEDFDSAVEVNEVFPFLKLESNGTDFQYSFNSVNMKTTNGDHEEDDIRKSISPEKMENDQKEENEEGEVTKDIKDETGDAEVKNEEEEEAEDDFWAQDDSKKRKKDEDEVVEESNESKEDGNETEDASKRLKTDGDEDKTAENEEEDDEAEIVEIKPEVESEKTEEKKDEDEAIKGEQEEEEEDDDFWAGKGD